MAEYDVIPYYISDSNRYVAHLDSLDFDYAKKAHYCGLWANRVRALHKYLSSHSTHKDGQIWLDEDVVVYDFTFYDEKLLKWADFASRQKLRYEALEQQRLELIEQDRQRALAKAEQMEQRRLDSLIDDVRINILMRHKEITMACDSKRLLDKNYIKERKDIYYAYLALYNRYNVSYDPFEEDSTAMFQQRIAPTDYLAQLQQLLSLQTDIYDSLLCDTNYTFRIAHFKDELRMETGIEYNDVFRSYCKYFVQPDIPIRFSTPETYQQYKQALNDVIALQKQYLEVVRLRRIISANSLDIETSYFHHYRAIAKQYKLIESTKVLTPSFANMAESKGFIHELADFVEVQQIFQRNLVRLDNITLRGDSIIRECNQGFADVKSAYKHLPSVATLVPDFHYVSESVGYDSTLSDFEHVQHCFRLVLELRRQIVQNDEQIRSSKNAELYLMSYYKATYKNLKVTPDFKTAAGGDVFLAYLDDFARLQQRYLAINVLHDSIVATDQQMGFFNRAYPNLYAGYKMLRKTYQPQRISSFEDVEKYEALQHSIRAMQLRFLEVVGSSDVESVDARMKTLRDIDQIRQLFGIAPADF